MRRLPFDQYQRYRPVADLLAQLGAGHVLDVGGGPGILRRFCPDLRVTLVDVVDGEPGDRVVGDGSRLPFRDDAFDAVAAFDTLEHVPPDRRDAFLAECRRVARRWVLLAGPYAAPEVRAAEESLDGFLLETLGLEHAFLREHLDYGLPDRAHVEQTFERGGARVASIGHGNLELWQTLMRLEMAYDEPHLLRLGAAYYELYARQLYAGDHRAPVYRHTVVAALGESALPDTSALFAPLDESPERAAIVSVLEEALRLVADDSERRAWMHERSEFQRAVAELGRDLAGHRDVLADRESQLAEHRRVQAQLEERVRDLFRKTPYGVWNRIKGTVRPGDGD